VKSYLAYAAVAPPSERIRRAIDETLDLYSERGPSAFHVLVAQRERLRQNLARLLGTRAERLAFVSSTTLGISDLALCMPWKRGERVLLFEGEFPANVTPWQRAAELFGLETRFLSVADAGADPEAFLRRFELALREGVRLVAVSAVQFQTGLRMPLAGMAALCREHGAELAVDAIQACGVIPLDVEALDLDYLVCGAHKWMLGVEGAGFVYAREGCARALVPRTAGWLSHERPLGFLLGDPGELRPDRAIRADIQFLEKSSMSSLGLAALAASVEHLLEQTPAKIFAHVSRYLDVLEAGLAARGLTLLRSPLPACRSAILSFVPPTGVGALAIATGLAARGVTASTPDGLVRFAPHYQNSVNEIDSVLGALDETLAAARA
jgi:selenocysteine lyase/cysteine desulfurase